MESSTATRRACFVEENYGLASIAAGADMEAAGFSGNHFISRPLCSYSVSSPRNRATTNTTNSTLRRNFSSFSFVSSPRSARFCDSRFEEHHHHRQPHFLDSCSFCNKPIGENTDIFMYRGDTPFCSEECRQEQIEIDEAKEKDLTLSSMKALRKKEQSKSPNKNTQKCPFRTGAVAAA